MVFLDFRRRLFRLVGHIREEVLVEVFEVLDMGRWCIDGVSKDSRTITARRTWDGGIYVANDSRRQPWRMRRLVVLVQ